MRRQRWSWPMPRGCCITEGESAHAREREKERAREQLFTAPFLMLLRQPESFYLFILFINFIH